MTLTVGSLFAGIGGFDVGLERAGMRIAWQSEIDPYASAVLKKHWPDVPNLGDIREIRNPPTVDVLCGGFPCQDISVAGKGAGIEGERSGLWREYARIIGEVRPRYVVVENVAALLGRGLGRVLGDLAALGFDAEWHCIPASAVGAPHRRDRLWIVAYANSDGLQKRKHVGGFGAETPSGQHERRALVGMATSENAAHARRREFSQGRQVGRMGRLIESISGDGDWPLTAQPCLGGAVDGLPGRLDRLRCLGNAIVPQIAEIIGRAIMRAAA